MPSVKDVQIKNKLNKLRQFNKKIINDDNDDGDEDDNDNDFKHLPSPPQNLPPTKYFPDSPTISDLDDDNND